MIKPFFLVIFVGFLLDLTENHSLTLMQPCTKNAQGEKQFESLRYKCHYPNSTKIVSTPHGSSYNSIQFRSIRFISRNLSQVFICIYYKNICLCGTFFYCLYDLAGVGKFEHACFVTLLLCTYEKRKKKEDRDGCR